MAQFQIKKATKQLSWLRMTISGPTGAGKTYTAIKLAHCMGDGKICVIDTQLGQASRYADQFDYDVIEMTDHNPQNFIDAVLMLAKEGYKYIIIDTLSHEWEGVNGCLEMQDQIMEKQRAKGWAPNSYTAWNEITPLHKRVLFTCNSVPAHVIATLREEMDYVQEKDDKGRTTVRRIGMKTIQRKNAEYDFDLQLQMNVEHTGVIVKSRDGEGQAYKMDGRVFKKPGQELADQIKLWLGSGVPERPAIDVDFEVAKSALMKKYTDAGGADFDKFFAEHYGECKTADDIKKKEEERRKQHEAKQKRTVAEKGGE